MIRQCTLIVAVLVVVAAPSLADVQKLKVGPEGRFLVKEDGSAFVWIGATMWKWKALSLDQMKQIIDDHSAKGYTVLQIIAYPDQYEIVDRLVEHAQGANMYLALVTGWYRDVERGSVDELYRRGRSLGERYSNHDNIIWLTAGEAGGHQRRGRTLPDEKLKALVQGIRDGDRGNKLLTVHADYKRGTSLTDDTELVDFDNWQTSQWCCPDDLPREDDRTWTVWQALAHDYARRPAKPTLDAEGWYERNKSHCGTTPFVIRRRAYFSILAGGFGHTYGAGGIWDGLVEPQGCSGNWEAALTYDGYIQIGYLSHFLHSLGDDLLKLRPDQNLIASENSEDYDTHIQAAVAKDRSFAVIYSASDERYSLNLSRLRTNHPTVRWFNPRNNTYGKPERVKAVSGSTLDVDPPGDQGPGSDWVLILSSQ